MSVRELIEHFRDRTHVPVSPNEVRDKIVAMGVRDAIEFVPQPFGSRVLMGMHRAYTRHNGVYAEPILCVDICYDGFLSTDWQRIVCCKELLHVFDTPSQQTSTPEHVEKLVEDLARGSAGMGFADWGLQSLIDYITVCRALAILFPMATRELLMPKFRNGAVTEDEIAKLLDIPLIFARLVLNDAWVELHETILQQCQ